MSARCVSAKCQICSNFFFPYQSAICLSWHCCAFAPVGLRCEKPLSGKYLVYGLKFLYLSPQTAGNFPNMSCKKQTLVATKSATKSPNGRWHLLVEVVLNWVVLLGSRDVQVTYTHIVEMLMSYVWNLSNTRHMQKRRIFQATVTIISRSEPFPSRFLTGWRTAAGLDPTPWRWRGWGYYVKRQNQSSG